MRVGDNPNKFDNILADSYIHQVIIPVYIPNEEGYFKDTFQIFKLCIQSLLQTSHAGTYITIVNNGSYGKVTQYLDNLLVEKKIQEVIHSTNIGKINAVLKGLVGINTEIVTVSDQDILFQENWQSETLDIFNNFPNVGVVGLIPMFNTHKSYCHNIIFDNMFSGKLKFSSVKTPESMIKFYDTILTTRDYNQNYLKKILTLSSKSGKNAIVGSGHLVASYRKNIFDSLDSTFTNDLLSGNSDRKFLDLPPLKLGYYRLTTDDNYAFHMGNSFENWMVDYFPRAINNYEKQLFFNDQLSIRKYNLFLKLKYYLKYAFVKRIVFSKFFYKSFLKLKGLEKEFINGF